ncbi:K(+)-insensitive pyrophosphate-energized proton pump [Propionispora sp. 2/2-37]|uniref:sodium-translocating pyrophosphatase n=1 Tax=Propionispora sp. 2/2-37 TaxID=1677858 RepID=UPI0006BEC154|nr:sodium-translocating pyrophosphatase [Propionispora sp. 2/2-37]CUH96563.1 K(+)-insensitive pyrophosphate-energized proton pump [Propionispora sp. 2/2-37]
MDLSFMIPLSGGVTVLVILYLIRYVFKADRGDETMQEIALAIRQGAMAFLKRQYSTIAIMTVIVAILLSLLSKDGVHTPLAFVIGAACSAIAGFIGMYVSVNANLRTASAARSSLNEALKISFRGGSVTGLAVTALSLLGVAGLFYGFNGFNNPQEAPLLIVGFGFGASFVALFAQLGGGIYTKAADVGADLVGKVEAGIPEDDPRNPAVIADLVGDNVGDCAGRGADLFESTAAENIGAMILGIALFPAFGVNGILFPLVARAFGLLASIVGIFCVRTTDAGTKDSNPMAALNLGYAVTSILSIIAMYFVTDQMINIKGSGLYFFACAVIGIITSYLFVLVTQYYTDLKYRPVREIARSCQTGPATTIITGFSVGLESVVAPVIIISAALLSSHYLGAASGLAGGGVYGTAVATMGMLSTCAFILAMDTFGPITDNAGGIVEMSRQPAKVRFITDLLDGCGNTTKAITKGYAIGSAALATFLLFAAYLDEVQLLDKSFNRIVDIGKPEVFVGGFLGAMLVFLFTSTAIRAVSNAAQYVIKEVRRQFADIPGIMEGTAKPDYATCVDIVTRGALKQMVLPGIIVVVVPILVGILLKAEAAASLLMIATITGILMALLLNNGGGAWDNAKKCIELSGLYAGKNSEAHKASIVGDTVGDPFKDTAGPSLHVLIKLLSTITLVLAAFFV